MKIAPITLFVYNRIWHTQKTIESLQKNLFAKESDLYVYSDGPFRKEDETKVISVREYIKSISGFKKVTLIPRKTNLGLSLSLIDGITEIVNRHQRIIVLEDDMVSSPYFLKFINEALEHYKNEEKIISIHGYIYPVRATLPETFFLKGADCWGWATWKRGWDQFEPNGETLLAEIRKRGLERDFDFQGAYPYTKMLEEQIKGKNDSWAIRWYASAFLNDKLTLYPGRSLIRNIGTDASGTHSGDTRIYDTDLFDKPIEISKIPIVESNFARKEIGTYMKGAKPDFLGRVKGRLFSLFQ
jgi:hypothetical protein